MAQYIVTCSGQLSSSKAQINSYKQNNVIYCSSNPLQDGPCPLSSERLPISHMCNQILCHAAPSTLAMSRRKRRRRAQRRRMRISIRVYTNLLYDCDVNLPYKVTNAGRFGTVILTRLSVMPCRKQVWPAFGNTLRFLLTQSQNGRWELSFTLWRRRTKTRRTFRWKSFRGLLADTPDSLGETETTENYSKERPTGKPN